MKRTIQVTQDDIDKGVKNNTKFCPIARAMVRTLGLDGVDDIFVGYTVAEVQYATDGPLEYLECPLPTEAKDFIEQFDTDHTVEPFEFEVDC